MNSGKTVFSQLMDFLPAYEFRLCVDRQLQSAKLFMLGPVSIDGLCSAHLSRKSKGYRDLSESCWGQALPHGNSRQGLAKHSGSLQRSARLENLPRLCPGADPTRQRTLLGRSSPSSTRSDRLCPRFHHRRSLPHAIPPGRSFESARQR
jgi:hypothetical protein